MQSCQPLAPEVLWKIMPLFESKTKTWLSKCPWIFHHWNSRSRLDDEGLMTGYRLEWELLHCSFHIKWYTCITIIPATEWVALILGDGTFYIPCPESLPFSSCVIVAARATQVTGSRGTDRGPLSAVRTLPGQCVTLDFQVDDSG